MKVFSCCACDHIIYFDNTRCNQCERDLLFLPDCLLLSPVEQDGFVLRALAAPGRVYRRCQNQIDHGACNWAVAAYESSPFCQACRLNRTVPDLTNEDAKRSWMKIEAAKRRLVYTLDSLGLPVIGKQDNQDTGLAFDLLQEQPGGPKILTGHDHGLITLNIVEADDSAREAIRVSLGEPYRTLLGHLRHESGHYYWERLVEGGPEIERFRAVFGDERVDYGECLRAHYASPSSPTNWSEAFVSAYASTHPWEDWAETWAHYLHMRDALETATACSLSIDARGVPRLAKDAPTVRLDANRPLVNFDDLLAAWYPLTTVVNSLNRCMGLTDWYPFVLTDKVLYKLRLVHDLIQSASAGTERNNIAAE